MAFIEQIAPYIQKYAPQYNIKVCSPIIAQAVLESASGTSELAVNAHNYFGLKYRAGRCPTSCGIYYKTGSEQNADGTYTSSAMQWMKFSNMENGVRGYFDFINISNYSNLKGVTDPETYLKNIKADGYATSLNYIQNLMSVIKKYNLTQYDNLENNSVATKGNNKMVINVHAGHNPDGKVACGAVGLIKESTEARNVKDKVVTMLKAQGHTVYDCTVDNGTSQNDILSKIVTKCNANTVQLDVSIHFNSGANDKSGNGTTTGTEVYIYSSTSKAKTYAQNIANAIATLGFKNRGVKTSTSLYFLKNTKSPALLIECCFVDDKDDVNLYNADKMAQAIVKGITGIVSSVGVSSSNNNPVSGSSNTNLTSTEKTKATYTSHRIDDNKWGNEITGYNTTNSMGYSGVIGKSIDKVTIKLSQGTITYTAHRTDGKWGGEITGYSTTDTTKYAGSANKPIDAIAIKASGIVGTLKYRVHTKTDNKWWGWITGYSKTNSSQYAGVFGKEIDAIQIGIE